MAMSFNLLYLKFLHRVKSRSGVKKKEVSDVQHTAKRVTTKCRKRVKKEALSTVDYI
jgi:DNA-binding LacI/PurR family transcriptional regulator